MSLAMGTTAATISSHDQRISVQMVKSHLWEAQLNAHHPLLGLDMTTVIVTNLGGQVFTFNGVWHLGKAFSSWMNPVFHFKITGGRKQHECVCGVT